MPVFVNLLKICTIGKNKAQKYFTFVPFLLLRQIYTYIYALFYYPGCMFKHTSNIYF